MDNIDKTIKFILLGESNVGKSSIVSAYIYDENNTRFRSNSCLDFSGKIKNYYDGHKLKLLICDIWGGEKFKTFGRMHYKSIPAIIIVFDLTNLQSFEEIDKWINDIKIQHDKFPYHIVLVGNKDDLPNRQITKEMAEEKIKKYQLDAYFEMNIKDQNKINQIFDFLINKIISDRITMGKVVKAKKENSSCILL